MSRRTCAALAVLALAAAGLAGCGKMGSLERPGPLFGHPRTLPQPSAQQQDPNRPVTTVDPRDENAIPGDQQPAPNGPQ